MHWMRLKWSISTPWSEVSVVCQRMEAASALAREVLPTPCESARITWPPAILAASRCSIVRASMEMSERTLSMMRRMPSLASRTASGVTPSFD